MKRTFFVLLALFGAMVACPIWAGQIYGSVGVGIGFGSGYGYPYRPMPIFVAPMYYAPRIINLPSTIVHVDGARYLGNGRCKVLVNSRWLRGVDRNGMCYVED